MQWAGGVARRDMREMAPPPCQIVCLRAETYALILLSSSWKALGRQVGDSPPHLLLAISRGARQSNGLVLGQAEALAQRLEARLQRLLLEIAYLVALRLISAAKLRELLAGLLCVVAATFFS